MIHFQTKPFISNSPFQIRKERIRPADIVPLFRAYIPLESGKKFKKRGKDSGRFLNISIDI
ncbi:hypothetical protein DLM77_14820 [Leptospira yasudae]|uniref:Uncharacterized protein n=1 Tax=Leptospira yasudae TaxID=2202201 RepID=A0ABX9M1H3_9LEPT|nr:hypothetical protein DLM77_14820 [Leptospira yasudae]